MLRPVLTSLLFVAFVVAPTASAAPKPLCLENTCLELVEVKAAGKFLGTEDGFLRALTPYDRAMRMKVAREVSREEFAKFAGEQAVAWTPADRKKVQAAVAWVRAKLAANRVAFAHLPRKVRVIKTTGREEGNAPYTREDVVLVPEKILNEEANLGPLLAHELVHVLLRSVYPERRDAAYALAGFRPIRGFQLPDDLGAPTLTNPDGFGYLHAAELADGTRVVPVLLGTGPYDSQKGGEFFQYLRFRLLEIEEQDSKHQARRDANGALVWRDPDAAYAAAVKSATGYVIHPDELIASNFEALLSGKPSQPGLLPALLKKHFAKQ